jgi:DNA repair protein RadC
MAEMSHLEQEHFKVLTLDTRNRVLADTTLHISAVSTPVTSVWARCFGRP